MPSSIIHRNNRKMLIFRKIKITKPFRLMLKCRTINPFSMGFILGKNKQTKKKNQIDIYLGSISLSTSTTPIVSILFFLSTKKKNNKFFFIKTNKKKMINQQSVKNKQLPVKLNFFSVWITNYDSILWVSMFWDTWYFFFILQVIAHNFSHLCRPVSIYKREKNLFQMKFERVTLLWPLDIDGKFPVFAFPFY